ncbi:hypothetical protein [uncultured Brevundimonas sp.]|uniref:hypothetical protein n=1 Tax=uncultured Brevundimonas sp. TaxID=213418 RepID=UPI0030EDF044|tara:strand:+ start:46252 stop:47430 length:1179 start_codon:yes stop_codon:yes gene_type:complete
MGEIAMDVSAELLAAILQALETPARTRSPSAASSLLARVVKEGFFATWQFEDYLLLTDPRLAENLDTTHLEALSAVAGAPLRDTVHRPNARSLGVVYTPAWAADDAASLLILLESLGFEIDPSPLVELLLPRLPRRGLITSSQLDIFWYARTRRKAKVSLSAEPRLAHCDVREWVLRNGHKVETWVTKDGAPTHCEVTGPGFRNRKSPVKTVCSDCGLTWYRGDPDSSASHRKEHRKRMVYLDPAPDPNMVAAMAAEADPERVTSRSPRWKQDALDERALLFRLETHYSFVGWGAQYEKDHSARGFLMTRADGAIVGCVVFRWREYSNAPAAWALQWVWVCPAGRRTGVLRSRWAAFRAEFGDFRVEGPVSPDMLAFLAAVEPDRHAMEADD